MGADWLAFLKMLFDDLRQARFVQPAIPDAFRVDQHDWPKVAGVQTACTSDENVARAFIQAGIFQAVPEESSQLHGAGRRATGTIAEQHMVVVGRNDRPVRFRGSRLMTRGRERGCGPCRLANQLNSGVGHLDLRSKGCGEGDLCRCGGVLLPPASHEPEPVSGGDLHRHESREHDHLLHTGPAAGLERVGYGRSSLLQQSLRHHPADIEGAQMVRQGGQLLSGLAAVQAATPNQHHTDVVGGGLAIR